MTKNSYTVILFYKFAKIKNPEKFGDQQRKIAESFGLKGRMLIATEGVNATFEGPTKNVKSYIKELKAQKIFQDVVFKETEGNGKGFTKLQVKARKEVVTLGVGELNIKKETAPVVTAQKLEKMYQQKEDFVVLDLRNDYEIQAGYFENTVNPKLRNFRELPEKIKKLSYLKDKKVVAVCTGGIRCEKATVLFKKEGFQNIYQLEDGIWSYMKKYPGKHFKGTLFTFDNRMVTPVADKNNREVVGQCAFCQTPCEEFYNDDSFRPSKKVICCDACIVKNKKLRGAISSVVERCPDKTEVEGPIPSSPTEEKTVVLLDDVMTSGDSAKEGYARILQNGGILLYCVVAFDRQERHADERSLSAKQHFEDLHEIPVYSVANLDNLITVLQEDPTKCPPNTLEKILEYKAKYGV
jgi:UPF0176 protein